MIEINLLPWREEKRKRQQQEFWFVFTGAVIFTALLGLLLHLMFAKQLHNQTVVNQYLTDQIAMLDVKINEVKNIKAQKKDLINKMQVIYHLQTNRSEIVNMFSEFVRCIPSGVYITSIQKKDTTLTVHGMAESNTRISEFMKNIDASESFMNPMLTEIKVGEKDKINTREFEISMTPELLFQKQQKVKQKIQSTITQTTQLSRPQP